MWNSLNSDFERIFRLYSFKLLFVDFRVISGQRSFIAYVTTRESIKHVFSFPLKALSQHDRHFFLYAFQYVVFWTSKYTFITFTLNIQLGEVRLQ